MEESVFGRSVLETVVTNQISSLFPSLFLIRTGRLPCTFLVYSISAGIGNTLSTGAVRMHNKAMYGSSLEDLAFFRVIFTVFTVRSINPFDFG